LIAALFALAGVVAALVLVHTRDLWRPAAQTH
jgi:hypothetical protein